MDSLFKVLDLCVLTFESGSANVLDRVAEVIVQLLITYEVPDFYRTSRVVGG